MLTLCTIPRAFHGHFNIIQRNAIRSWTLLHPDVEVILFGCDEGTAELAAELGVRHEPDVAHNQFGVPMINSLFDRSQELATHDLICYVHADIVLMSDFGRAIKQADAFSSPFLMVGQRWDVDVIKSIDFDGDWETALREFSAQNGVPHAITGIDYLVFRRGLWGTLPPFVLGRPAWDNWMIYRARKVGAAVIDASLGVTAVHQNHGYAHQAGGVKALREGVDAQHNHRLTGSPRHLFTLRDATHQLTPLTIKRAATLWHLVRQLETIDLFRPRLRWPQTLLLQIIKLSTPLRHPLKLVTMQPNSMQ